MRILIIGLLAISFYSCKKSADTKPAVVTERLEISPSNNSLLINETKQLSANYYNGVGQLSSLPAGISWSSLNPSLFTVSSTGVIQGLSVGQGTVQVTYQNIKATALVNVIANSQQLAIIKLSPQNVQQIKINQSATIVASGETVNGVMMTGLSFSWQTDNSSIATVENGGIVTGKTYGTALVSASSMGIQSAPVMVQVVRSGNFSGSGSGGTAVLSISNNTLMLTTSANFVASNGAPDLRMYLTNNPNSVANAIEIATLNQRTGAQNWNVASPTSISQYRYALIWCKQFGGNYGVADLGL